MLSGVFGVYVPAVPDVTIVPGSLKKSVIRSRSYLV